MTETAARYNRIPGGHPEGLYEAFANVYLSFANALWKKKSGQPLSEEDLEFPDVRDGVRGVRFIDKCVESSRNGAVWVPFE
jgi:hypothetical protein